MNIIFESEIEQAAIEWFNELGYAFRFGPEIAQNEPAAERNSYEEVVLGGRLFAALERINTHIPQDALNEAFQKIVRVNLTSPSLSIVNHAFHRMLTEGIDVSFQNKEGRTVYDKVWVVDFDAPEKNDWLVVNQYTVIEDNHNRRADLVVFVNGLPLAVIELKNPAAGGIRLAYNQLQHYKQDIPSLFAYNEALVISDGLEAGLGTLTSGWERFLTWRTIDGQTIAPKEEPGLEILIKGVFNRNILLDLIRNYTVFEVDGSTIRKKTASYHQYHAVKKAVECTLEATSPQGDKRVGVIWHTQGSGKSLTMAFYAGIIIKHPEMKNPTLVVITDRNDLDDQLFGTFSDCHELLRQKPIQALNRNHARKLLNVQAGGVIFTTIQKFMPEEKGDEFPLLSDRRNIVVIADEAHRSQYDFIDGFARHMRDGLPNASFIGFTGTPIEAADKNTPAVFGEYIDIYDIYRAVEDGATVSIHYESRLAKIELNEDEKPHIDPDFDELMEGEEQTDREKLKTKWARLEALVGSKKRIDLIAKDIVQHYENRLIGLEGKAMIVCMSRRICVELYNALVALRPAWHDKDDDKGTIKVVMTGSVTDPPSFNPHIRSKAKREELAKRFKDPDDEMKLVIVRDMWLTGFDVPCLHTMYLDKPMRGHGLMQAIARVNRVFKDKPGGLVVDYIGIAEPLKKALSDYTEQDKGKVGIPQSSAVAVLMEKYEIVKAMFHGFDYATALAGSTKDKLAIIIPALEHILAQENGKKRYIKAVNDLSQAFALSVPHEWALRIRDEVGFFQLVRAKLIDPIRQEGKTKEEIDTAVRQIVSKALITGDVVDIFSAAGLNKPDISILSESFLEEVKNLPQKNVALEVLKRLLSDEIRNMSSRNVVKSRLFSEMLQDSIIKYNNRTISSAQVIQELIDLAKDVKEEQKRGEKLGLNEAELAFYDALETNDSAVKILGDDTLKKIAFELVQAVRHNSTIDWTLSEGKKARLKVMVKRVLRKFGYPPDKQEKATQTVLEQAETLCKDWAA